MRVIVREQPEHVHVYRDHNGTAVLALAPGLMDETALTALRVALAGLCVYEVTAKDMEDARGRLGVETVDDGVQLDSGVAHLCEAPADPDA